jgi:carboxypeptidase Taq
MTKEMPDWKPQLKKGDFTNTKQWLTRNVHSQGNLYDPPVLLKRVTGKELTVKPYLAYLNEKYSKLYGF